MEKILNRLENIEQMILLQQKNVFTPQEAAGFLGVTLGTIYKMTSAGLIPFSKPNGKLIYFSKEALIEWMLSNPSKTVQAKESQVATYISTHK